MRIAPKAISKEEFGHRLRQLMTDKGWSQSELARQSDLQPDAVSTYVRGLKFPSPANLAKLAGAFGIASDEVLPGAGSSVESPVPPAIEFTVSSTDPDRAKLHFSRDLPTDVALEILQLIRDADKS